MVRRLFSLPTTFTRFPHSRGDGPRLGVQFHDVVLFSPLAWGWSVVEFTFWLPRRVFPTRVGMVRNHGKFEAEKNGFPHSRGDGPPTLSAGLAPWGFSPLAWGWSVIDFLAVAQDAVFPTRVGMVRAPSPSPAQTICFPHSRGDGPAVRQNTTTRTEFSPLAWGWSALRRFKMVLGSVFPTRVGMVRKRRHQPPESRSFPHSRGDGPPLMPASDRLNWFSPLAWGWSGFESLHPTSLDVFPTRVGMVRGLCR